MIYVDPIKCTCRLIFLMNLIQRLKCTTVHYALSVFRRKLVTFSTSPLKSLYRIQRNLTEGKMYMFKYHIASLCFWTDRKTKMAARPLIDWEIFDFSSETTEQNSTKLDRKQDLNVFYQVYVFRADRKKTRWPSNLWLAWAFSTSRLKLLNGIWPKLTVSKISTFVTDRKTEMTARPLRYFRLLLWNRWTEFKKT